MTDIEKIFLVVLLAGILFVAFKYVFYKSRSKPIHAIQAESNQVMSSFWTFIGILFIAVMAFIWAFYRLCML